MPDLHREAADAGRCHGIDKDVFQTRVMTATLPLCGEMIFTVL